MSINDNVSQPEAKFNAGIAKLQRLNELKIGCHRARVWQDNSMWFQCLLGIRAELDNRMTEEEIAEANQLQTIILDAKTGKTVAMFNLELFLGRLERRMGIDIPDKKDMGSVIGEFE